MGGSSQTIGWNYRLAWHDCICLGPLDAFLEFRGADKQAWKGRMTSSGVASVYQPRLWGGDKDQGGAVGDLRVLFGEAGQMPPAYLTSVLSPRTGAWRGIATVVWEGGLWGANNPYQQKRAYRVERIVKGWDNDDCWYPAKAPVPIGGGGTTTTVIATNVVLDPMDSSLDGSAGGFDFSVPPGATIIVEPLEAWSFTPADDYQPENYSNLTWWTQFRLGNLTEPGVNEALYWNDRHSTAAAAFAAHAGESIEHPAPEGGQWRLYLFDGETDDNRGNGRFRVSYRLSGSRFAKNPAHMILFAHTQKWAGRQPRDSVDLVQLQAAADWYYARGFGLCTRRKRMEESPREFIKRIEKVAGCSFSQSFDDGLWHLDIANGEYVLDDLPVITDADVLSFKFTPTTQDDAVNSVSVQYFDPERKEKVITTPTRAMGLIARFGEIHQTFEYPEIPIGRIALMVALRELLASITPGGLFELDVMPWLAKLRKNQYVRLQLPKRGIADMVCLVGEVKNGKLKSGAVKLNLGVDIYSLPLTVFGGIEVGTDPRPPAEPIQIDQKAVFEAPYIDAVASMPADDFAALPEDAGYVVAAASNPGRMRNFTMMVAPDGGDFDEVDEGEFCPSCTLTGEVQPGLRIGIGYEAGRNMAAVRVGTVGTLNGELVRVDAHDLEAMTLDLGRGCGDTLPRKHDAGDVILFYQVANGYDRTQHIAGETVQVKLLTNSVTKQMPEVDAEATDVNFVERLARPYNNGDMKMNGVSIFAVGTSTPGGGGGGGGGSGGGGGVEHPVRIGPGGVPLSPVPGPNGGFPDDAPYPIPQPTTIDTDIMPGGGFDDPADLALWRKQDGSSLGPEWALVDGELTYSGASGAAYCYGIRLSLPIMPFPRYSATVTAKIRTTRGMLARFGVGWGSAMIPVYIDAIPGESDLQERGTDYPDQTEVTHTFELPVTQAAGHGSRKYYVITFMPAVEFLSESFSPSIGKVDDVTMSISRLVPDATDLTPTNLDFSAGLTGWSFYPDPTGNPYAPSVSVSGGEVSMTGTSQYFDELRLICDDPITAAFEIGKYFGIGGEAWSNDTTLYGSDGGGWVTAGGVTFGYAINRLDGSYSLHYGSMAERGDWTPREVWMRMQFEAASLPPGWTIHALITLCASPGFTTKVRNPWCKVTDEVID